MNRIVLGFLILLLGSSPMPAADKPKDKPSTPEEQYKALDEEYQAAQKEYQDAMRTAKTQEERQKVYQEKFPKADKLASQFLELAEKNPKSPAALDALVWVISHTSPFNPTNAAPRERALELALRDHLESERLTRLIMPMRNATDKKTEAFLRAVLEKNQTREVQGQACLALALLLKGRTGADKEAEQLLDRVIDKYSDIKPAPSAIGGQNLGAVAKRELFEIRNLAVGKPVPDIEGEDLDGAKFKLSDYRGKVVMLDFWGHW